MADFKDSNKKSLYLFSTSLLLGDSDYYNKPSDMAKALEAATTTYLNKILVLAGYSKEDASKKVAQAYQFEKLLAPSIMGSDEFSKLTNQYETLYNPYTLDDLDKLAPNLKLKSYIQARTKNKVNKVIVAEPKWLKALDKVYTNDNIELLKNYLEIHFLMGISGDLSEDFLTAAVEYANQITGATGSIPDEEKAMNAVQGFFTDEIGKLYCDHYFSKESKADVEKLVKEIIAAYKKKIEAVDWMTAETKKNAIKKLDTMKIKIGYPEKWDDYSKLEIKSYEEGGSLLQNSLSIMNWQNEQAIDELDKPVDKTEFGFPPQMVNACYDPSNNDLTFPAAILQAPYYDIKQSREKNLGAIGVVIAHEISHAFDTSGANFDCNGNLVQWWTPEDYAKFQEKANTFKTFYSNITTDSGDKVNGDLTVGENIADITAMSCMLDIMKEMDHPDYKAFFESWANAWHMISTPEYTKLLLEQDVHSPNKVRANAVVQQFQEFYDTYDVKEGDGMYVKPEDRLKLY